MKKILGAAVGVGMLLATVVPTFAAYNKNTGPGSINVNADVKLNVVRVRTENNAFVMNEVTSVVNSGGNSANFNTKAGNVKSGDATSCTYIYNNVNQNNTVIKM